MKDFKTGVRGCGSMLSITLGSGYHHNIEGEKRILRSCKSWQKEQRKTNFKSPSGWTSPTVDRPVSGAFTAIEAPKGPEGTISQVRSALNQILASASLSWFANCIWGTQEKQEQRLSDVLFKLLLWLLSSHNHRLHWTLNLAGCTTQLFLGPLRHHCP